MNVEDGCGDDKTDTTDTVEDLFYQNIYPIRNTNMIQTWLFPVSLSWIRWVGLTQQTLKYR